MQRLPKSAYEIKLQRLFYTSNVQQLVFRTMVDMIMNASYHMFNQEWRHFITDVIEAYLIAGFVIYKLQKNEKPPIIADISELTLCSGTHGNWHVCDYTGKRFRGWDHSVMFKPRKPQDADGQTGENIVRAWHYTSPCTDAVQPTLKYEYYERNWARRDFINSKQAVFTGVDPKMEYAGQNNIPFYLPRDVNPGRHTIPPGSQEPHMTVDPSFAYGLAQRPVPGEADSLWVPKSQNLFLPNADPYANVSARNRTADTRMREMVNGRDNALRRLVTRTDALRDDVARAAEGPSLRPEASLIEGVEHKSNQSMKHAEFIVSDGHTVLTSANALVSTTDGHMHWTECHHAIFFAFGLPPQTLGRSVQTERTASNHAQFGVARRIGEMTQKRYKTQLNELLDLVGGPSIIDVIAPHVLNKLGPLFKVKAHIKHLALTYNVEESIFDPVAVQKLAYDEQAETAEPDET